MTPLGHIGRFRLLGGGSSEILVAMKSGRLGMAMSVIGFSFPGPTPAVTILKQLCPKHPKGIRKDAANKSRLTMIFSSFLVQLEKQARGT